MLEALGRYALKPASLTDDVLLGDIWLPNPSRLCRSRSELSHSPRAAHSLLIAAAIPNAWK